MYEMSLLKVIGTGIIADADVAGDLQEKLKLSIVFTEILRRIR